MKEGLCGLRVKVKDALGALVSWLGDRRGKEMNIKKLDRYNIRLATDFISEIAEVRK